MPNRDQRRRDGTFEYAQLDLAPASDEPARCEHGEIEKHAAPCDCSLGRPGHTKRCRGPAASGGKS